MSRREEGAARAAPSRWRLSLPTPIQEVAHPVARAADRALVALRRERDVVVDAVGGAADGALVPGARADGDGLALGNPVAAADEAPGARPVGHDAVAGVRRGVLDVAHAADRQAP